MFEAVLLRTDNERLHGRIPAYVCRVPFRLRSYTITVVGLRRTTIRILEKAALTCDSNS